MLSLIPHKPTGASIAHLDGLRSLAALIVVVGHLRAIFFADYASATHRSIGMVTLYALTGLGHQAVMIFFVLSGFLISSSVLTAVENWSWRVYLIKRCSRLGVVLIPALVVTALLDLMGAHLRDSLYTNPIPYLGDGIAVARHGVVVFFGNLGFLQTIMVPTFGSNGALWSLSNEFWYYVLFPALLLSIRLGPRARRPICVGLTLILFVFLPLGMSIYFLVWLLGAGIHALPIYRGPIRGRKLLATTASAALILALAGSRIFKLELWGDLGIGLSCAGLIYTMISLSDASTPAWYRRCSKMAAGFSYTLYAVHLPFLIFIAAAWPGRLSWQPTTFSVAIAFVILIAALVFAYCVAQATEARTSSVRGFLLTLTTRTTSRKPSTAAAVVQ